MLPESREILCEKMNIFFYMESINIVICVHIFSLEINSTFRKNVNN